MKGNMLEQTKILFEARQWKVSESTFYIMYKMK